MSRLKFIEDMAQYNEHHPMTGIPLVFIVRWTDKQGTTFYGVVREWGYDKVDSVRVWRADPIIESNCAHWIVGTDPQAVCKEAGTFWRTLKTASKYAAKIVEGT